MVISTRGMRHSNDTADSRSIAQLPVGLEDSCFLPLGAESPGYFPVQLSKSESFKPLITNHLNFIASIF